MNETSQILELTSHSSIFSSQVAPARPGGHLQVKVAFPSIQVPPCLQGFESHSFISIPHSRPVKNTYSNNRKQ